MLYITNDRGQQVIAVGADGSLARVKVQYPNLINKLNDLYIENFYGPGRRVDLAVEAIRDAGISNEMETNNLLQASLYSEEPAGSVTSLVMRVGRT